MVVCGKLLNVLCTCREIMGSGKPSTRGTRVQTLTARQFGEGECRVQAGSAQHGLGPGLVGLCTRWWGLASEIGITMGTVGACE